MIRKATPDDIPAICDIYRATHIAEEQGLLTIGWMMDGYPNRATAEEHLADDDLFVMEDDGRIVATAVINSKPLPEYEGGNWRYPAPYSDILILHTFIVHPSCERRGYGSRFLEFFEDYARQLGRHVLRMDTQAKNVVARRLYARFGYSEADIVDCNFDGMTGLRLVLIEKLTPGLDTPFMRDNSNELFPIVAPDGTVVGSASRGECHGGSMLLHPVVHLHVFNSAGELYLQRRPMWKDIQPGRWDTAVGGHVDYGETIDDALRREAREELGLTVFQPTFLQAYVFESARERELINAFSTVTDAPIFPSDETDGGRFWKIAEIREALTSDIFTPNFVQEFLRLGF